VSTIIVAGAASDLADGEMKAISIEGHELLIARAGDDFYAAEDRCPHMGARLSQGVLQKTVVVCPRHGSRFDLTDGRVIDWTYWSGVKSKLAKALKSPEPLKTYRVQVDADRLLVALD